MSQLFADRCSSGMLSRALSLRETLAAVRFRPRHRAAAHFHLSQEETMMTDRTQTPAGLVIEKRNWKFGRDMQPRRWWHGGDAGRTAFYNALSSTFPVGEKFFMAAVRHYRDEIGRASCRERVCQYV